jgi:H+/Cl- antiporter ClcA
VSLALADSVTAVARGCGDGREGASVTLGTASAKLLNAVSALKIAIIDMDAAGWVLTPLAALAAPPALTGEM